MAVYTAAGLGFLEDVPGDNYSIGDQTPVDYVANAIVASTALHANKKNELKVVQTTSSVGSPLSWSKSIYSLVQILEKLPVENTFKESYNGAVIKNINVWKILFFYKRYIPSVIYTNIAKLTNNPDTKMKAE